MISEAFVILSCLILACSASYCPECPRNDLPCHELFRFGDPCPCSGCLTKCPVRDPVCPKGKQCITEEVYFGKDKVGYTATCKPFVQCPQIQCPDGCPESGYFVDVNNCTTCLCNDPCKELKCKRGCLASSSNPGTEPDYYCK